MERADGEAEQALAFASGGWGAHVLFLQLAHEALPLGLHALLVPLLLPRVAEPVPHLPHDCALRVVRPAIGPHLQANDTQSSLQCHKVSAGPFHGLWAREEAVNVLQRRRAQRHLPDMVRDTAISAMLTAHPACSEGGFKGLEGASAAAHLPHVVPELVGRLVRARAAALRVVLQLLLDGAQVHRLLDYLVVVRNLHADRSERWRLGLRTFQYTTENATGSLAVAGYFRISPQRGA